VTRRDERGRESKQLALGFGVTGGGGRRRSGGVAASLSLSLSVAFVRVGFGTRRDVMRRTGTRRSTAQLRLKT
jgi:hypothetical protein